MSTQFLFCFWLFLFVPPFTQSSSLTNYAFFNSCSQYGLHTHTDTHTPFSPFMVNWRSLSFGVFLPTVILTFRFHPPTNTHSPLSNAHCVHVILLHDCMLFGKINLLLLLLLFVINLCLGGVNELSGSLVLAQLCFVFTFFFCLVHWSAVFTCKSMFYYMNILG